MGDGQDKDAVWVDAIDHVVRKPPQGHPAAAVTNDAPGSRELQHKTEGAIKLRKEVASQTASLPFVIEGHVAQFLVRSRMELSGRHSGGPEPWPELRRREHL